MAHFETLPVSNFEEIWRSIREREEAGGILIRPNVAIPHVTVDGIHGALASLGIQESRVPQTLPNFWLLFISGSDYIKEHLAFLRTVALTLTDDVLHELAGVKTGDQALRILAASDS